MYILLHWLEKSLDLVLGLHNYNTLIQCVSSLLNFLKDQIHLEVKIFAPSPFLLFFFTCKFPAIKSDFC